jgi:hypothetical protein
LSFLLNQKTESIKVNFISSDISEYKASLRLSCIIFRGGRIIFERDQIIKPYKSKTFPNKASALEISNV